MYGEGSFASSFPNPQDIFMQEVWKIDENGAFSEKLERTAGLLVKDEEMSFLEFFE